MKERRQFYHVEEGDEGPLSQYLRRKAGLTPHQIRSAKFQPQGICVNGSQARVTAVVKAGDCVSILLEGPGDAGGLHVSAGSENEVGLHVSGGSKNEVGLHASAGSKNEVGLQDTDVHLDILYEDEDLLIVNKPAGVAMHPAHGHFGDTLTDMVAAHFREKGEERQIRSIGRLDKETSGVVVFAKNRIAAARLSGRDGRSGSSTECDSLKGRGPEEDTGRKSGGSCEKEYLAVCEGHLKEDEKKLSIHLPMRKVQGELNRMEVCPAGEGLEAHTYIEKIRECGPNDLLRVRITTGRTHQIRVHLAALGHPLSGDAIYAGGEFGNNTAGIRKPGIAAIGIRRAALHCAKVRFRHPLRGEWMEFEAPLPEDMQQLISTEK